MPSFHFKTFIKHAAIGALALALIACSSAEERAQNYYKSGQELLAKNDFARASVEFRNALKLKDDFADAWYGMAQVEQNAQNWPKVFGDLNKVLELQPKHRDALVQLARLSMLRGDFPLALEKVNTASEIKADDPDVMALKAAILLKLDDKKGAAELAEKALALKPNHADASIVKASLQSAGGDDKAALATIEAAVATSPKNMALYILQLSFYEKAKDLAGQEKVIRSILVAFPDQVQFKNILVSFYLRNGRGADAEKQLRADMQANPEDTAPGLQLARLIGQTRGQDAARAELETIARTAKTPLAYWIEIANLDYAAGRKDEAITNLQKLVEQVAISDEGIALRLNLAGKQLESKKYDDAGKVIEDVLKNDAQNAGAQKLKAALLIEKGDSEGAILVLREALNSSSSDPAVRLLLANAYEKTQSLDLAAKEYSEGYSLSNGKPDYGMELANFQMRRGDIARAEATLSEIASRNPQFRPALTLLADIRLRKQDWKGAEEIAKMIDAANGDKNLSQQIMGESLLGQKRFDEAINLFQVSTAKTPDAIQPMYALVRSYLAAGKPQDAVTFINGALKANPDNANAYVLLGTIQLTQKLPDAAISNFETAIAKDPASPAGYMALAQFHMRAKDGKKAIEIAQSGLGKVRDDTELRLIVAGLLETTGELKGAVDQYEALIAKDINSPYVINNYVSIVSDTTTDMDKLKRAAALGTLLRDSPIPEFQETYGWVLVLTGNVKEGLQLLERVSEKLANNATARFHLGSAYALDKNTEKARLQLQAALKLDGNDAIKVKAQKLLDELPK